MTIRTVKYVIGSLVTLILLALILVEIAHHFEFGHFIGYGLHADVIQRSSSGRRLSL